MSVSMEYKLKFHKVKNVKVPFYPLTSGHYILSDITSKKYTFDDDYQRYYSHFHMSKVNLSVFISVFRGSKSNKVDLN